MLETEEIKQTSSLQKVGIAMEDSRGETYRSVGLKPLTILIGHNGSGKSFMLVSAYVIAEIANLVALGLEGEVLNQTSSFIVKGSYHDMVKGQLTGEFEHDLSVTIDIEDGKVFNVTSSGDWKNKGITKVRYLSAGMRTFNSIKMYLFARKAYSSQMSFNEVYEKMCETFKIYDINHIETLINSMPLTIPQHIGEALKNFDINDDPSVFDVDLENCDFFYQKRSNGEKVYMTTLGSGHQSIFNMIISQA